MSRDSNQPSDANSPLTLKIALNPCLLVAALRWITPDEAEDVTPVLTDAGFRLIEAPLNSPYPLNSIERLAWRFGSDALIRAGTVMTPPDVTCVRDAGGRLIVMPHADTAVVSAWQAVASPQSGGGS